METVTDITYKNPYIQVVWEDNSENFTQEKIKSVKEYFQKKYDTTSVNIITKNKNVKEITNNVDVSFNIMDNNYQVELINEFLKIKYPESIKDYDEIITLDNIVNNEMLVNNNDITPFKKWYIKNIEFSNFLSYGENQKIDFEKYDGISVIESFPRNFGGKTVISIDLPLFLFFNETTKTSKAEEIFNTFTDKNKVTVRGEIVIDGDDYIIERNVIRKLSKSGEWNVKTELEFFKKMSDGSLLNFTGEQRRETEAFIKASIGTKEDFLMTILTTANNLEEFIDSKPTARGTVLSRFMGLDFLKRKEEIGKEMYSKFSKSMISNIYNSESLKNKNDELKVENENLDNLNESLNKQLIDVQERIIKGQTYRDELNNKKHIDIDREISQLVPEKVENEINGYNKQIEDNKKLLSELKVVEPSEFYHEDKHDEVKKQYDIQYKEFVRVETEIKSIEKLQASVSGGIICEHCGIDLMNASITQAKINELAGLNTHKDEITGLMNDLTGKEQGFVKLKKEFDEYEKNKLIKEKYELTIESLQIKVKTLKDKLDKYFELQLKILDNDKIEGQLIKANQRLSELDGEKNTIIRNIENNSVTVSNNEKLIDENLTKIKTIKEESEKERIFKIYLDIFGKNGISKLIMRNMIPLINSELQRLLMDSSYFRVEVRLNAKNEVDFIMIDNNTQVEKSMSSGSGYEKTIASLALRSVLSKVCSLPKPNIVVFDEIFGKISNDNLELVSEFFIKIKEYFEKIFIITHNPMVENWADNIIKIKKEDNISYLEN